MRSIGGDIISDTGSASWSHILKDWTEEKCLFALKVFAAVRFCFTGNSDR